MADAGSGSGGARKRRRGRDPADANPPVVAAPNPPVVAAPNPPVIAAPNPPVVAAPNPPVVAAPNPPVVAAPNPPVVAAPNPRKRRSRKRKPQITFSDENPFDGLGNPDTHSGDAKVSSPEASLDDETSKFRPYRGDDGDDGGSAAAY